MSKRTSTLGPTAWCLFHCRSGLRTQVAWRQNRLSQDWRFPGPQQLQTQRTVPPACPDKLPSPSWALPVGRLLAQESPAGVEGKTLSGRLPAWVLGHCLSPGVNVLAVVTCVNVCGLMSRLGKSGLCGFVWFLWKPSSPASVTLWLKTGR